MTARGSAVPSMYAHIQRAPLFLLLLLPGIGMLIAAGVIPGAWTARAILLVVGGLMMVLTFCFRQLSVRSESEALVIEFGPLPLFRRRLLFAEMEGAAPGRTTSLDGWGIHMSPRGGWTWNLWGYDCVHIALTGGRQFHIGTNDAAGLAQFLQSRIGVRP
ncbi:MAG: hypothetical protein JNG89_19975 [Planctomycetaceae bacterium]|nr:hypothetical protein [Planctomycetaceae bacterium]